MGDAEDLLVVRARIAPSASDLRVVLVEEGKVVSVARTGHHGVTIVELGAVLEHHRVSTEGEAVPEKRWSNQCLMEGQLASKW